ncbi:MAG: hypothetical protein ACI4OJ_09135 [Lachnospiraceae bacterium]
MAMRDEVRRERAKLKGKGVKAHLAYFWDYYRLPTFLIAIGAALVIGLIVTQVTAKETAFDAVLINADSTVDTTTAVNAAGQTFADYAGIDTDKYDWMIDNSQSLSQDRMSSQYDYATIMKLAAQMAAKQIDVLVANPSNFSYYALNSSFLDLREVCSEDQLKEWEDAGLLWYVDGKEIEALEEEDDTATEAATESDTEDSMTTPEETEEAMQQAAEAEYVGNYTMPDPDTMEDPIPVGVVVTNAPYIENNNYYGKTTAIAGVVVNTEHKDLAAAFLTYLFDEGK